MANNTTAAKSKGRILVEWLTTTDHKKIGYLYLITSVIYFVIAGVMALVIRAQLAAPGLEIVASKEQYNQLVSKLQTSLVAKVQSKDHEIMLQRKNVEAL
jgi:hypothetical protein